MSRARLTIAVAFFIGALGGAFALVGPASAAVPSGGVPVTVCGNNSTWYVNSDENGSDPNQGDRRPLATSDGLVFAPKDLIHHQISLTVTSLMLPGTFVANPAPDIPDFFSAEVWNAADGSGYATLRWNSVSNLWEVTTGGATHTDTDPANLLTSLGKSTTIESFGVGYTNNPPGTVTTLVSSISFAGTTYKLNCPVAPSISPSPVPVPVPGPTHTVIVTHTLPGKTVIVRPTLSPTAAPTDSPTPAPSATTDSPTPTPSPVVTKPVANSTSLWDWAAAIAGIGGAILVVFAIAKMTRGRRNNVPVSSGGRHSIDDSQTQMLPTYHDPEDDGYSVGDYHPSEGFDPALGGTPGSSLRPSYPDEQEPVGDKPAEPSTTADSPPANTDPTP